MKRRIIAVALLALAVSAGSAMAQSTPAPATPPAPGGGQGFANRRMTALLQGITLTPAQQTRLDSVTQAFSTRLPAMERGAQMDSTQRAQRMQVSQQRDAAYRAVLTPEQQTVWDTNVQTMQANMPRRPGN